jgi:ArsR family transcriptional regulator
MDHGNSPSRLFRLLGHPARLAILGVLRDGEQCVCHMEAVLGYRQAYISQHLMTLREAGLVQDRRDGPNVYYRVVQPDIFHVIDAGTGAGLAGVAPGARTRQPDCPCPKCHPLVEPAPA